MGLDSKGSSLKVSHSTESPFKSKMIHPGTRWGTLLPLPASAWRQRPESLGDRQVGHLAVEDRVHRCENSMATVAKVAVVAMGEGSVALLPSAPALSWPAPCHG